MVPHSPGRYPQVPPFLHTPQSPNSHQGHQSVAKANRITLLSTSGTFLLLFISNRCYPSSDLSSFSEFASVALCMTCHSSLCAFPPPSCLCLSQSAPFRGQKSDNVTSLLKIFPTDSSHKPPKTLAPYLFLFHPFSPIYLLFSPPPGHPQALRRHCLLMVCITVVSPRTLQQIF